MVAEIGAWGDRRRGKSRALRRLARDRQASRPDEVGRSTSVEIDHRDVHEVPRHLPELTARSRRVAMVWRTVRSQLPYRRPRIAALPFLEPTGNVCKRQLACGARALLVFCPINNWH